MKLMTMHNNGTTKIDIEKELQSQRHGGPYDRGSADSYYSRKFNPHYYVADTLDSDMVEMEKISKGIYHGHNFHRYLFIYNSKIYLYGGQGLWSSFVGLLEFNKQNKEWFKKEIQDYPFEAKKVVSSWLIGDKIKVLLSLDRNYNKITSESLLFGEIDLINWRFKEIGRFSSMISNRMQIGKINIIQS